MRPTGSLGPVGLVDLLPVESPHKITLLQCCDHKCSTDYICFMATE